MLGKQFEHYSCPTTQSTCPWQYGNHSSAFPDISLGFTILLLPSQLYLWGSPSSSAFPAISLGFTFFFFCLLSSIYWVQLLLLPSQLHLWGSPFFFFFFCLPSYISGVHHSSSVFPAISLGFTIWGEIYAYVTAF